MNFRGHKSKAVFAFSVCALIIGLVVTVSAQTTQKTDPKTGDVTTTEPSDKYGAGGTHVTTSDKKFRLIHEYYYDKNGKLREDYYPGEPKDNFPPETTYYDVNGNFVVKVEHRKSGDVYYDKHGKIDPTKGKALVEETEKTPSTGSSEKAPEKPKEEPKKEEPKKEETKKTETSNSIVPLTSNQLRVETTGTGETIGHVADFVIQNLTDQPIECVIPPMILESRSGKNQTYACPKGDHVALKPHELKSVSIDGVCVNRDRPPVGKGVAGDLAMNDGSPNVGEDVHLKPKDADKLLRLSEAKYKAADELQKDGALKDMPYHDKQKQKDIVVQWSTWSDPEISEITGSPPATKEDLKKVVYKQLPHTPTGDEKKKIDHGIDTIFEKVELTTAKAKELKEPEQGPKIAGVPPFNGPQTIGGPGNQPVGGPKGGAKGGGAKGKGNEAAAVCSDCSTPEIKVTHDDPQINEVKTGPYGATSLRKPPPKDATPYDLTVDGGCIKCGKDSSTCCCAITEINVGLHFQINVNTDRIDKGVWMNTTDDPKKLGRTKTTAPKDGEKDKDEWKKVDKESVVTHEKKHCDDLSDKLKEFLKEVLKEDTFTPVLCPDKDCKKDDKECKKLIDRAKGEIDRRVNANINEQVKQIAAGEVERYPAGDLEQNARKAQAKDLNDRNK